MSVEEPLVEQLKQPTLIEENPFKISEEGVIKICKTRVPLDTVIYAFLDGASAEEIVQRFPTLTLAEVYQTIGYYLRNRSKIDQYLKEREAYREAVRQQNEERFQTKGIRERLLVRQAAQG